jgi:23S rRNA (pseudouridine1915-N3)-methyltransferase
MQTIQLLCVGKLKEGFYIDAAAEYVKRLGAYCKLTVTQLPEERLPDRPSPAQIDAALDREGTRILEKLPAGGVCVALCVEGELLSSQALAARLEKWAVQSRGTVSFLVGGSYGLHPKVKQRSDLRVSMSPMTFPHHLARIMVLEQIYRAFQINQGTNYQK